jgi:hypothetical protein
VLQWALERHCPWDEETCKWAAVGGYLEVLKLARQHNCPWDEDTCTWRYSSGRGSTTVRGMRTRATPLLGLGTLRRCSSCSSMTVRGMRGLVHAAQGGHLAVLVWAREHGCPWDADNGLHTPL